MTEEKKAKRRGWVKNAAIIFLSIMLVLTFASNTIMNRSLPEVSAQYPTSGSITEKVRGSGVVEANQTYEVSIGQTRKVQSVPVKVGDTVSAGDTLFVLEDTESDELDSARDTLAQLELDYQKALISATYLDYVQENVNIQRAKDDLNKTIDERDALNVTGESLAAARENVERASASVAALKSEIANIERQLEGLSPGGDISPQLTALDNQISEKNAEIKDARTALDAAKLIHQANYDALVADAVIEMKKDVENELIGEGSASPSSQEIETRFNSSFWQAKKPAYVAAEAAKNDAANVKAIAYNAITGAQHTLDTLNAELSYLQQQRSDLINSDTSSQYGSLNNKLKTKQSELSAAESQLNLYEEALAALEANITDYETLTQSVITQQRALEDMIQALVEQQRGDNVTTQLENLNLEKQRKDINAQRELISELQADAVGAVVKAAQGGVISSLNVTAGNTAQADMPMAVIELTDGGYSLSFTVTTEQSRKVTVGDVAEVTTFRWGADITATLADIKNDPSSAGKSKILQFTIKGDVTVGEQLNLSVGQKSSNYETIVPNSAVRTDNNGDFILIVESRSSPLSTRYAAVRVDVTVLSKDDTSSAVTGALTSWDFVITTSSAPLEPGMLVRLADK